MARSTKTGESGFTLIELLVVLTMIVVLASMGLAQYRTSVIHSREAVLREDLFRMREAIDQYYADKAQWPSTLDALVSDGYLRKLPEDPFTKSFVVGLQLGLRGFVVFRNCGYETFFEFFD